MFIHAAFQVADQAGQQPPAQPAGPVDVHLDLSGLANLIWQQLLAHLGDIGAAIWQGLRDHLGEIGQALWTPLSAWLVDGLREAAQATWDGIFGAVPLLLSQLPAELTYNLPAYRAIATDPLPVAVGGATLALVLLGLRTGLGALVGRDHVLTHVTGRLIPATFLALAYPILVVRAIGVLNAAAAAVPSRTLTSLVTFPALSNPQLLLPYLLLWGLLIFFGVRLLVRTGYAPRPRRRGTASSARCRCC